MSPLAQGGGTLAVTLEAPMACRFVALPGSSGLLGPATSTVTGGSNVLFRGAQIVESAGTPALAYVTFRLGSATGAIIYAIKVAASGAGGGGPLNSPIIVSQQIYYNIESGAVTGSAYFD